MVDFNPMSPMPEGETVESTCNSRKCGAPRAPLRLRAMMIPRDPSTPQVLVPGIVLLATRQPPEIVTDKGVERNPKFDALDTMVIASWVMVEELCNDEGCFQDIMKRFWSLGQRRLKLIWKQEERDG